MQKQQQEGQKESSHNRSQKMQYKPTIPPPKKRNATSFPPPNNIPMCMWLLNNFYHSSMGRVLLHKLCADVPRKTSMDTLDFPSYIVLYSSEK